MALDIRQGMRPRDALAQRSLIDAPATWKILVNSRKGDESQRVIRFWISRLGVLRIRLFDRNFPDKNLMRMQSSPKPQIKFTLITLLLALTSIQLNASVVINVLESSGGVIFSVNGDIAQKALTKEVLWWSPASRTAWEAFGTGTNDMIHILGDSAYRYSISGAMDTGVLNVPSYSSSPNSSLTGTGYSIGTSYFGGTLSLLLSDSYKGEFLNYTVFFSNTDLIDLGLSDGQTRLVTFDDGSGGRESIRWNIGSAVPEPSLTLLLGLGALGHAARRRRTN